MKLGSGSGLGSGVGVGVGSACEDEAPIGREFDETHGRVVVVDEGLEALARRSVPDAAQAVVRARDLAIGSESRARVGVRMRLRVGLRTRVRVRARARARARVRDRVRDRDGIG